MNAPRPTVNVEQLRKVLEYVTAHPEKHNQLLWTDVDEDDAATCELLSIEGTTSDPIGTGYFQVQRAEAVWTCNTSACLAGWGAMFDGARPIVGYNGVVYRDGEVAPAEYVARRAFGLTAFQANTLFHPKNTVRDLWRFASRFTDGAIEVPEELR